MEKLQAAWLRFEPDNPLDNAAIRWPTHILKLRREQRVASEKLDAIVTMIRNEQWAAARAAMADLPR